VKFVRCSEDSKKISSEKKVGDKNEKSGKIEKI